MLGLAEQAYAERVTHEELWTAVLEVESDNMRVALEYARFVDAEKYLELVGALAWFWIVRTHLVEGREHLTEALASSAVRPFRPSRARALWGAAHMLALQGETSVAQAWIDEARTMSRDLGETREIALALEGIGWTHFFRSEDEAACTAFEECLRLQQASGDQHLVIRAMVGLAQILVALGRTGEAKPMAQEIIEFAEAHNDKRSEHFGWHYLADCELILGNCKESLSLYKKSLTLVQPIGDKVEISFEVQGVAMSLAGLGLMGMGEAIGDTKSETNSATTSETKPSGFPQASGDTKRETNSATTSETKPSGFPQASGDTKRETKQSGFPQAPRTAFSPPTSERLQRNSSPAREAQVGQDIRKVEVAIQLAGAVKAEWDRLGVDIHVRFWDALLDRYLGSARRALGTEDFEREWNKGRELLFDDAVKLALEIEAS
jgi:tetratricopeptide (TPR) repeat protein